MKKLTLLSFLLILLSGGLIAGGIVTNSNQSACFIRNPSRDASLGLDGIYYNPAGLVQLGEGLHFAFHNQTLVQQRKIVNGYQSLNDQTYIGDVFVPLYPSLFMAYNQGPWAFHGAFFIAGGGGSADYDRGLPSFEQPISDLPDLLSYKGIPTTAYSANLSFKGTSVFYSYQAGISYKLNEMLSFSTAARYLRVRNTYKGNIENIMINPQHPVINPTNGMMLASDFFTTAATLSSGAASSLTPLITGGGGSLTLNQAVGAGYMTETDAAQLQYGLGTAYSDTMNISEIKAAYTANATAMTAYAQSTSDKEVDVVQTGSGLTPIIGVNLNLLENRLNIGIKYEFATKIEIENDTKTDDVDMFPDGEKIRSDMPALLSVGASWKFNSDLKGNMGIHYYWDKQANYGKKIEGVAVSNSEVIDENGYEVAAGLEYQVNPKVLLSGGYLYASTGAGLAYQTDLTYTLKSHSFGFGTELSVAPRTKIDLGIFFTQYIDGNKTIEYASGQSVREDYYKKHVIFSVGFTFNIGK